MKRIYITLIGLLICAGGYAQGMEMFSEGGKWGFRDSSGNVVVPAKYDAINDFSEGLIAVRQNEKWGFVDETGNEVIPPKYDNSSSFSKGVARVNLNDKWFYIDKTGEEVTTGKAGGEVATDRSSFTTPATIKVIRRKSMLGAVVPYQVYINSKHVGNVKNGGTLEIPVHTSHNVVTASDGVGFFESSSTVVLEEGGGAEVYVKARQFINK